MTIYGDVELCLQSLSWLLQQLDVPLLHSGRGDALTEYAAWHYLVCSCRLE